MYPWGTKTQCGLFSQSIFYRGVIMTYVAEHAKKATPALPGMCDEVLAVRSLWCAVIEQAAEDSIKSADMRHIMGDGVMTICDVLGLDHGTIVSQIRHQIESRAPRGAEGVAEKAARNRERVLAYALSRTSWRYGEAARKLNLPLACVISIISHQKKKKAISVTHEKLGKISCRRVK